MKIVILGGGPTGLGAAWRLYESGFDNWELYERNNYWGGLSASFCDEEGFYWDVGGHVLFSHYPYFDKVMNKLLGEEEGWLFHERESWIRMQDRFIPYPLQNNIHRLPKDIFMECLEGIIDTGKNHATPITFADWINASFGAGLAKWFLTPYNYKVWAYPPEDMAWSWVGERVATVDIKRVMRNYVYQQDDIAWGPNSRFRFPKYGATGGIWREMAARLPGDQMALSKEVSEIRVNDREIRFTDGKRTHYDVLLSTIPITHLIRMADLDAPYNKEPELKYSSCHIVGLAMNGTTPDHLATKCWMYFPESNCPFYRTTVFSNYSPHNVPDISKYWSLMCEVSESPKKNVNREKVVEDVIQGAVNTGLINKAGDIHHTWSMFVKQGYPTPSLNRNDSLFPALVHLESKNIYSRGRFGGWRYEVGNMDHSFMQGVEFANRILHEGEELTLWYPNIVNTLHPRKAVRF